MTLRTASALAAVAATLLVAGCGGSDDNSGNAAAGNAPAYDYGAGKTPVPSSSDASATIKAAAGALGSMLVDAEGRTLYLWEADKGGKSTCEGPCADAWPPVTTVAEPQAGEGVDAQLLGTTKLADGTLGVTYNGHPLYYFQGDGEAGQANGQGSDGFGAPWWIVSPQGAAIEE